MTKKEIKLRSKKPPQLYIAVILLVLAIGIGLVRAAHSHNKDVGQAIADTTDLTTVIIPDETPSIIIDYEGFTVNFNPSAHMPNYVAWDLTPQETQGKEKRASQFYTDNNVLGCATPEDYRNSGFDRGHIAPAGDMKYSSKAMQDCFYLTNICPQSPALNQNAWRVLEENCRKWATIDSTLIIIAGPVLTDRLTRKIGKSGIPVPQRFFKVILAPHATPPRAIGFIMPNTYVQGGMATTATSVDNVEAITGYDFFSQLPDSIENIIEANYNLHQWTNRRTHKK